MQRKIVRAKEGRYSGGDFLSCIEQMVLFEKYWIPELDHAPRVLVHGDLSPNNIIVDEHYDIQGRSVIDLGWAEMVPLQFAAAYPRFLTHEPRPSTHSSSASFDYATTNTATMQQDRLVFRECVQARALSEGGIYQTYYDLLSRKDEVNRYWWFKAISEADKHKAMKSCNWAPDKSTPASPP
ncbi:hypothetical protein E4T42_01392 [Aureobasidium subglaciale]|nr:hypothetical protein E4T42_01392 [Aureobasidium subglaciale]